MNELALFAGAFMKTCSQCKRDLPVDSFYRRGNGLRSECKECAKAMTANWYAKNADDARAKVREWNAQNKEKVRAYRQANRRKHYLQECGRKYGVTPEWFEARMAEQNNSCATCGKPFSWDNKQTKPHVDHCHVTGKARGILCNRCNSVIGLTEEQQQLLLSLAEYLKCHG
jgi:5-methylcytosine-specific restriction endonuclease McrA